MAKTYKQYKIDKFLKSGLFWGITTGIVLVMIAIITLPIVSTNQIDYQKEQMTKQFRKDLNSLYYAPIDINASSPTQRTYDPTVDTTKTVINDFSLSTNISNHTFDQIKTSKSTVLQIEHFDIPNLLNNLLKIIKGVNVSTPETKKDSFPGLVNQEGVLFTSAEPESNGRLHWDVYLDGDIQKSIMSVDESSAINIAIAATGIPIEVSKISMNEINDVIWWKNIDKSGNVVIDGNTYSTVGFKDSEGQFYDGYLNITTLNNDEPQYEILIPLHKPELISSFGTINTKFEINSLINSNFKGSDGVLETSNTYYVYTSYEEYLQNTYMNNSQTPKSVDAFYYEIYNNTTWKTNFSNILLISDSTGTSYSDYLVTTYNPEDINNLTFSEFKLIFESEMLLFDNSMLNLWNEIIDLMISHTNMNDMPFHY